MANDAQEEFWGITLTKAKKEYLWDPSSESEEDVEHKLQLTTACVGHNAKDGDRNVVEVTTEDGEGKKVTCPFVSLRVGGTECIHLDLGFYNTTKFTLTHGAGPISLCGVHLKALPLDFDENDEDSSEDEEVPDLVPSEDTKKTDKKLNESDKATKVKTDQKNNQVKRPLPVDKDEKQPPKKKKPVVKESSEEEDDDEEEDEDEDEDMEEQSSLLDNEAEEGSEEDTDPESDEEMDDGEDDDDDDEGDSEGDEDDDEDEDKDEDDDEESEEEEKPASKKVNGQTPKQAAAGKTPKNKTPLKTPVDPKKTPGKKDNTPKSQQAKKTPAELKAFLLKSPNLPKKFDKFANFMKNNMKVTDEKSQKELWDYVQKNKK